MTTITPHTSRATGTILTAAIYNFDHNNHVNNATALNAGKIEGVPPSVVDGRPVVWSGTSGNAVRTGTQADAVAALGIRENLLSTRTYYVRTDGSDSNTGLVDSAGGAFLTIQKAIDVAFNAIDQRGLDVDIQVRDGTYAPFVLDGQLKQQGTGKLTVKGNNATPANVIITGTLANDESGVVDVRRGAVMQVQDMELRTVTTGSCLYAKQGATILFQNIRFGACAHNHIFASVGGFIQAVGNYSIVGSAATHIWANANAEVRIQNRTITLTGTPAFSAAFAWADYGGVATLNANTWSGAATGSRFACKNLGVIVVNGGLNGLPGNASGFAQYGGVYDKYEWTTFTKAASEIRASSATLANDSTLQFTMDANTTYVIRMKVYYDTAATPGFKYALSGPATPSGVRNARKHISAAAPTTLVVASETGYTASTSLPGGTVGGYIEFDLFVANGANAGAFAFQWAQDTSNASNTIVQLGSYIEYRQIAP